MTKFRLTVFAVVCAGFALAATASAITFGEPDGTRHPYVGALVAEWNPDSPGPDQFCSGTLVSPTLFLTAAHCMSGWPEGTEFWVTFSPEYDEDSAAAATSSRFSFTMHEDYGQPGGGVDAHDIAIVALAARQSATPAELPALGLLNTYSQQQLRRLEFTTVGYGIVRTDKTGGPHSFIDETNRLVTQQTLLSLQPTWLLLNMNPSTGSGGPATATRRTALSRRHDEQPGCRAHGHRRRELPRDRQGLPPRHGFSAGVPVAIRVWSRRPDGSRPCVGAALQPPPRSLVSVKRGLGGGFFEPERLAGGLPRAGRLAQRHLAQEPGEREGDTPTQAPTGRRAATRPRTPRCRRRGRAAAGAG